MNKYLFILLLLTSISCKKDDVDPTGSLKITYQYTSTNLGAGPSYQLYTEASYLRNDPLQQGTMSFASTGIYSVTLTDLNSGNYVISAYGGSSRSTRVVQVTAGRERDYSF